MMKGKRLIGLIIAGVLLVFVVCVLVFGGEEPAVWTLRCHGRILMMREDNVNAQTEL